MKNSYNEIGKRYGKLTVIEEAGSKNSKKMYKCLCDCGNTIITTGVDLRSGHTSSCGCLRKVKTHNFKMDLVGTKFGELTIISPDTYKNGKYYWNCQCSCGKMISTEESNLKAGKSKSCAECAHKRVALERALHNVPIGSKFGRLTVLEKVPAKNPNDTKAYFRCKCDCGKETIVASDALRNGKTKSCGCYRKDVLTDNSVIGEKHGMLTIIAIDHIERTKTGSRKYVKCKCDCGKEIVVRYESLIDPRPGKAVVSCGCLSESYGEKLIREYLESKDLTFKTEQTFDDLCTKRNNPLRYDFAVKSRNGRQIYFLIEYDGIQHFEEVPYFKTSSLQEIQERDAAKTNYAKEHNIPLLRISYTDMNNISSILESYIKTNFSFLNLNE